MGLCRASRAALVAAYLAAACGEQTAICDGDEARAALASAEPGSTVSLGACEVVGPLSVPPGVTLRGEAGTVVVAPPDSAGVVLMSGEPPPVVAGVSVRVEGRVGVIARPGAKAAARDLAISASAGVGLAAQGVDALEITRVTVRGPVDADNADDPLWIQVAPGPVSPAECPAGTTCDCEPGSVDEGAGRICDQAGRWATVTATHGLYLEGTAASLEEVDVHGFASFGAAFLESDVTWTGGLVTDVLGVGVRQDGGELRMAGVTVRDTHQGLRGEPVYAIAATGADLIATDVEVSNNDRYGLVVLGGSGELGGLLAENNGDAAVWAGEMSRIELSGAVIRDNAFAGFVVIDTDEAIVEDVSIEGTRESRRAVGDLAAINVGDGMHVMQTATLSVARTTLRANARAGATFDLGEDGSATLTFSDVTVEGSGDQLGAVAGTVGSSAQLQPADPASWGDGITRLGATVENDQAFTSLLDAVGATTPGALPSPGGRVGVVVPMF